MASVLMSDSRQTLYYCVKLTLRSINNLSSFIFIFMSRYFICQNTANASKGDIKFISNL